MNHLQLGGIDNRPQAAGQVAEQPDDHGDEHHDDEEVGGDGENRAGFLHPAQVDDHHEEHQRHGDSSTRQGKSAGTAEVICATPDEMDTATVRM